MTAWGRNVHVPAINFSPEAGQMSRILRSLLALALVAFVTPALASQAPAAPTSGWRAEYITVHQAAMDKYIQLAEAIPADKYTWRPGEGVRSIAETFLHVASANYSFAGRLGAAPVAGLDLRNLEKSTTDKAAIVQHLRASLTRFRDAVAAYPEANAEVKMRWFGNTEVTMRYFLTFNADHNGEHLGQSIAYARMNGIVPPWSQSGGN
jgi:uncharacterized damage-inducible protein DinB